MSVFGDTKVEPGFNEIKVTAVNSPSEFYCVCRKNYSTFINIQDSLNKNSKDLEPIANPSKGIACVVLSSFDYKLHRAEILKVSNSVTVHLVDHGRTENAEMNQVFFPPHNLIDIPSLAIRCSLQANSQMGKLWNEGKNLLFKKQYLNKLLVAKFIQSHGGCWFVEIFDAKASFKQDISAIHFPKDISKLRLSPGSLLKGSVSWFITYSDFYAQLSLVSTCFNEMMSALQIFCNSCSHKRDLIDPKAGDIVAALFTDEVWYRAKILSIKDKIEVYFIDYGNKKSTHSSHILPLPYEFSLLPEQAIWCRIEGITLPGTKEIDQNFLAEVQIEILNFKDNQYSIDLHCNGKSLLKTLGVNGLGYKKNEISTKESNTVSCKPVLRNSKDNEDICNTSSPKSNGKLVLPLCLSDMKQSVVQYNCQYQVYITYVTKSTVWVQIGEDMEIANKLLDEMNQYYALSESIGENLSCVDQDQVVAGRCTDGNWYRCVITQCSKTIVSLRLIDYGNTEELSIDKICVLADKFRIPLLCLECDLDCMYNIDEITAEDMFNKLFCQNLSAEINQLNGKHVIKFTDAVLPEYLKSPSPTSSLDKAITPVISKSLSKMTSQIFYLADLFLNTEYGVKRCQVSSFTSILIEVVLSSECIPPLTINIDSLSYPAEVKIGAYYTFLDSQISKVPKRIQVLSFSGDKYLCLLIDEGATIELTSSSIYDYQGEITFGPHLWMCCLSGVDNTETNIDKLKSLVEEGVATNSLTMVPIQFNGTGSYVIQLYKQGVSVVDLILTSSNPMISEYSARLGSVIRCISTLVSESMYEIKIVSDLSVMNHLANMMYEYFTSKPQRQLTDVKIGALCASFVQVFETYCRGNVLSIEEEDKIVVYFIDYGHTQRCCRKDLFILPTVFLNYRAMSNYAAIKYREAVECESNFLVTNNEKKNVDLTPIVYLASPPAMPYFAFPRSLYELGAKFKGYCCFFSSPTSLWVQTMEESSKLCQLTQNLTQSYDNSKVPLTFPMAGDSCVFYYTEDGIEVGSYFRGLVLEAGLNICKVQFVDYGNSANVSPVSIYVLKEEFTAVPMLANYSKLQGCADETTYSEDILENIGNMIDYKELDIKFIGLDNNGTFIVDIFDGETNLAEYLNC